ncbi:FAD/NAD(P)-binding protein [Streptomyces spongiae]|uniref:NAD(P)/FAD-dependent oxidoreductase n=1 Tax=Streptomyces spongiae TaxID=565072 RepID=A0A5N8X8L2_9ACTN|nr:FAD/NAD(P)-binding protein [Streptomyces spongiae]MPY55830.1 NAD(P)/FAD-dependent oxidoreductase [Streptomyces spongiae]
MKFRLLEELDESIRDSLADNRFYGRQSWVTPARAASGDRIHDAVVVGAGQNGLSLAYNLRLRGVRRIKVLDAQPEDRTGPWSSFARMPRLRTPKALPGPDCDNPLLRFKTWFCAAYSEAEYATFDFIPLPYWREYLSWYRRVLEIETVNGTRVDDITWDASDQCLSVHTAGPEGRERFLARRVCLATGITGSGRWSVPEELTRNLPVGTYHCAWEDIPWDTLADRDVVVIGAGASGFDNAGRAVEAGCRSATVIGRSAFPKRDVYFELWRGRDDSEDVPEGRGTRAADLLEPLLAYHPRLADADRLQLVTALFEHGRSPANPEYLSRVRHLDRIRVLEGWPIESLSHDPATGRIQVTGQNGELSADAVIFATGPQIGLEHREELRSLTDRILTWGDRIPAGSDAPADLCGYPKLSPFFQLQSKDGDDTDLSRVYCLSDIIHNTVGIQSSRHVVTTVADHVAASLYAEQFDDHIAFINGIVTA